MKVQIESDVLKLQDSLLSVEQIVEQPYWVDINCDLYRVRELRSRRIDIDWSTAGMTKAVFDEEKGYDELLNKYYKLLKSKLSIEDQTELLNSQRNWLKFRDSERKVNGLLCNEEYSGGGSIQSNIRAGKYCSITEQRLTEIIGYLNRIVE